jgi:hypothetical protein
MEPLKILKEHADRSDKQFVIIGGHAMNAYGISRNTGDIDLLVPRDDKAWWHERINALGITCFQDSLVFARFKSEQIGIWPIDLMFTDASTFKRFYDSSIPAEILGCAVQVALNAHIVALKLHAMKSKPEHRYSKDIADVVSLMKYSEPKISLSVLEEMSNKYATREVFDDIVNLMVKA